MHPMCPYQCAYHVPGDPRYVPPDDAFRWYLPPDGFLFPPDPNLRQAMVNLLADTGVRPGSLQTQPEPQCTGEPLPGLVAASTSTDTTPPTSVITPADGARVAVGIPLTVTGSAADTDGVVAGVQVSIDGRTWQPAVGCESFSYAFTPNALGPLTIRSRAVDDSISWEDPSVGITVNVT
jgi:hypothetical protein